MIGQLREQKLRISTPGRICLFGEHQDYLHLPVLAAAISRRIHVEGARRKDRNITIDLPNIQQRESFEINHDIPYVKDRDYFRSVVNVLQRRGFTFSNGFDCVVRGNIPINAGTASSSALVVGWTNFLVRLSDEKTILEPMEVARIAYEAEVLEFGEPGGMMDQYSTSVGGLLWIDPYPEIQIVQLRAKLNSLILGNSHLPKDTSFALARVKKRVQEIVRTLAARYPEFSLQTVSQDRLEVYKSSLDEVQFRLLTGTVRNREISREAKNVLQQSPVDHKKLGDLLNDHQNVLRDILKISTPKIDRMIDAAMSAGAYGAKINGSGGGGCMFAYASENPERVLEAVRRISDAFVVSIDDGSKEERSEESL